MTTQSGFSIPTGQFMQLENLDTQIAEMRRARPSCRQVAVALVYNPAIGKFLTIEHEAALWDGRCNLNPVQGEINPDETGPQACSREVREETMAQLLSDNFDYLGSELHVIPIDSPKAEKWASQMYHVYICITTKRPDRFIPGEEGIARTPWISASEIPELLLHCASPSKRSVLEHAFDAWFMTASDSAKVVAAALERDTTLVS